MPWVEAVIVAAAVAAAAAAAAVCAQYGWIAREAVSTLVVFHMGLISSQEILPVSNTAAAFILQAPVTPSQSAMK